MAIRETTAPFSRDRVTQDGLKLKPSSAQALLLDTRFTPITDTLLENRIQACPLVGGERNVVLRNIWRLELTLNHIC